MHPDQQKTPDWESVREVRVLIPGPTGANSRDLLSAYVGAKTGVCVDDDLTDDVITALERRLPLHVTVSVGSRGPRSHPMHGVDVRAQDGDKHRSHRVWPEVHDLARGVLDALIQEFRGYRVAV